MQYYAEAKNDAPNIPVVSMFQSLQRDGYELLIWTGRSASVKQDLLEWLKKYNLMPLSIRMRKIGDRRTDTVIKKEWLDKYIPNKEKILCVFDDRKRVVDMWRKEGITCLQVAEGNF